MKRLLFCVLLACAGKKADMPTGGGPTNIGSAGGSVLSDDGKATLVVPPGALAQDVTISITRTGAREHVRYGYKLEPSGLTFATPAKMTVPGEGYFNDGKWSWPLVVLYSDSDDTYSVVSERVAINTATKVVTVEVDVPHFSALEFADVREVIGASFLSGEFSVPPPAAINVGTPFSTRSRFTFNVEMEAGLGVDESNGFGDNPVVVPGAAKRDYNMPSGPAGTAFETPALGWTCTAPTTDNGSSTLVHQAFDFSDAGTQFGAAYFKAIGPLLAAHNKRLSFDGWTVRVTLQTPITCLPAGVPLPTGPTGATNTDGGLKELAGIIHSHPYKVGATGAMQGSVEVAAFDQGAANKAARDAFKAREMAHRLGPGGTTCARAATGPNDYPPDLALGDMTFPRVGGGAAIEVSSGIANISAGANIAGAKFDIVIPAIADIPAVNAPAALDFFAFDANFAGGVYRSSGDLDGAGYELIGPTGGTFFDQNQAVTFAWAPQNGSPTVYRLDITDWGTSFSNPGLFTCWTTDTTITLPDALTSQLKGNDGAYGHLVNIYLYASNVAMVPAGSDKEWLVITDVGEGHIYFRWAL